MENRKLLTGPTAIGHHSRCFCRVFNLLNDDFKYPYNNELDSGISRILNVSLFLYCLYIYIYPLMTYLVWYESASSSRLK